MNNYNDSILVLKDYTGKFYVRRIKDPEKLFKLPDLIPINQSKPVFNSNFIFDNFQKENFIPFEDFKIEDHADKVIICSTELQADEVDRIMNEHKPCEFMGEFITGSEFIIPFKIGSSDSLFDGPTGIPTCPDCNYSFDNSQVFKKSNAITWNCTSCKTRFITIEKTEKENDEEDDDNLHHMYFV